MEGYLYHSYASSILMFFLVIVIADYMINIKHQNVVCTLLVINFNYTLILIFLWLFARSKRIATSSTEKPNPIIDRDLATSVDNKTVPSYLKLCPIMKRMGRMVYDRRRRIFIGSTPI